MLATKTWSDFNLKKDVTPTGASWCYVCDNPPHECTCEWSADGHRNITAQKILEQAQDLKNRVIQSINEMTPGKVVDFYNGYTVTIKPSQGLYVAKILGPDDSLFVSIQRMALASIRAAVANLYLNSLTLGGIPKQRQYLKKKTH